MKEPKTESSKRTISIPDSLAVLLKEYKAWYDDQRRNNGDRWVDSNRLFVQENGEGIYPGTVHLWLKKILTTANLPHHSVHSLRHTNITMQIMAGVPIVTVSGRVGHSKTSTTTDIYSHFIKSGDKEAARIIEEMFD